MENPTIATVPDIKKSISRSNSDFLANLLSARGITAPEDIERFLNPSYEEHLHDPFLMKNMERACVRIFEATEAKEKIVVYSDYDCDGIPGAVMLHDFFKKIKYENFTNYIPDRHTEGYGLNYESVEFFRKDGVNLIITVDLGTTSIEAIALAQGYGIDVIVLDHHEAPEKLPQAFAILNPKQPDDGYPEKILCGSGVVFKLIQALTQKYGEYWKLSAGWEKWLLDMAGLATLSDMVPLVGENRVLAYYGLLVIRKNKRVGLQKLFKKLNIDARFVSEDDLTFMVTPRLNAASRMDSPMRAFQILATTDEAEAGALADHLAKINDERKTHVAVIMKEVKKTLEKRDLKEVIVIGNPKWRVGVLGLVASKIVEEYGLSAFVWGMEGTGTEGAAKGSSRSDGTVNIVELMRAMPLGTFLDCGGHERAGGFSVTSGQIHSLEEKMCAVYKKIKKLENDLSAQYESVLGIEQVSPDIYRQIEKLAPFGTGNAKPIFLFQNTPVAEVKLFGKEKNHLELACATPAGKMVKAISFFSSADSFSVPAEKGKSANLLASFDLSRFGGRTELRLRVVDIL